MDEVARSLLLALVSALCAWQVGRIRSGNDRLLAAYADWIAAVEETIGAEYRIWHLRAGARERAPADASKAWDDADALMVAKATRILVAQSKLILLESDDELVEKVRDLSVMPDLPTAEDKNGDAAVALLDGHRAMLEAFIVQLRRRQDRFL